MRRGTWFGSEDSPGPARRKRWPASSLVSKQRNIFISSHKTSTVNIEIIISPVGSISIRFKFVGSRL